MKNNRICSLLVIFLMTFLFSKSVPADDLDNLFNQVEKLNLVRHGYVLGAALTREQMKKAVAGKVDAASKGTFKFRDRNVFVVVRQTTQRIVVIYERLEDATRPQIQDLIGGLYLSFGDPTVMAHDKVVYWAYDEKGKILSEKYDTAKKNMKKIGILATVKCISDIPIMGNQKESSRSQVYYIISSEPILKLL